MATKTQTKKPEVYRAGVWVCPRCNNSVQIFVNMTAPPSCHNHLGNGITVMERKSR